MKTHALFTSAPDGGARSASRLSRITHAERIPGINSLGPRAGLENILQFRGIEPRSAHCRTEAPVKGNADLTVSRHLSQETGRSPPIPACPPQLHVKLASPPPPRGLKIRVMNAHGIMLRWAPSRTVYSACCGDAHASSLSS
jgi:hypothetical protein